MTAEEAKKVEVKPECPAEPPPPPAVVVEENKPPTITEEKPVEDIKPVVVVEKSEEPCPEKPEEGSVHRDAVLARVASQKKDALIKAWEESERSKVENRAQKKLADIGAWENSKKAQLEAELKKIEVPIT